VGVPMLSGRGQPGTRLQFLALKGGYEDREVDCGRR
jgi:hypothetical protein